MVGAEIAKALDLTLDLIVTRKIGSPSNPEYAVGALAETGEIIWNESERKSTDEQALQRIVDEERAEAQRRAKLYRSGRPLVDLTGKIALIIDDGLATGYTMRAAIAAAKHQHADKIVIAVPHGAKDSLENLKSDVDEVVALERPEFYGSVGQYYNTFPQVEDAEVLSMMKSYGPKP